jgi:hypothetical protein
MLLAQRGSGSCQITQKNAPSPLPYEIIVEPPWLAAISRFPSLLKSAITELKRPLLYIGGLKGPVAFSQQCRRFLLATYTYDEIRLVLVIEVAHDNGARESAIL